MSFQERRSLVSLVTSILTTGLYAAYMFQRYPAGDPYSPEVFRYWGNFYLILIVVSIVAKILIAIVFAILNAIATREAEPAITDERDKLIELKSNRNSLYAFTFGFLVAMAALAAGQTPTVMFIILLSGGAIAEAFGDVSQFLYYRRGV